ncbi:MAG: hypothetical protein AB2669_05670, partial [Candidatus Thiodiazotropha endolucinida]
MAKEDIYKEEKIMAVVARKPGYADAVEIRDRKENLITHKPQPFSGGDKASAEYAKQQRATVQS